MAESSLHAALKRYCAKADDQFEVLVDGYLIDVVSAGMLIEIQTGSFHHLKPKLFALLEQHQLRVVYPVAVVRWIEKRSQDGSQLLERRKSPKKGRVEQIFMELDSFPGLILHPNLSIQVILTHEVELRVNDGRGSWRRKGWSTLDRQLVEVIDDVIFTHPSDFLALLPPELPSPFTNRDLAKSMAAPLRLAQKMVYCLHRMGLLTISGKRGKANLFQVNPPG